MPNPGDIATVFHGPDLHILVDELARWPESPSTPTPESPPYKFKTGDIYTYISDISQEMFMVINQGMTENMMSTVSLRDGYVYIKMKRVDPDKILQRNAPTYQPTNAEAIAWQWLKDNGLDAVITQWTGMEPPKGLVI